MHAHLERVPCVRGLLAASVQPAEELADDAVEVRIESGTGTVNAIGIVMPAELCVCCIPKLIRGQRRTVFFDPLRVFHDFLVQAFLFGFRIV